MKCLLWSIFTSLPQTILAVPSFMFVETFKSLLPLGAVDRNSPCPSSLPLCCLPGNRAIHSLDECALTLIVCPPPLNFLAMAGMGFAAGCMLWIVFAELLPDAMEAVPPPTVATAATLSAASLEGFRMLLANVQAAPGAFTPSHAAVLLLPAMGVAALAALGGPAGALAVQTLLPDRLHGHVPGRAGLAAGAGAALAFFSVLAHLARSSGVQTVAELLIGSFGYLLLRSRSLPANARPPLVPVFAGDGAVSAGGFFSAGPTGSRDATRKRTSVSATASGGAAAAAGKDVESAQSPREARCSVASAGDASEAAGGFGLGFLALAQALTPAGRAALFFTLTAAANAACEGLMVGAGAHRASGGEETRVLLPGALTSIVRGMAVVAGVQSLTRMRSAAMCAAIVVALAQLVRAARPQLPDTLHERLARVLLLWGVRVSVAHATPSHSCFFPSAPLQTGSATGVFGVPHFAAKGTISDRALATTARNHRDPRSLQQVKCKPYVHLVPQEWTLNTPSLLPGLRFTGGRLHGCLRARAVRSGCVH